MPDRASILLGLAVVKLEGRAPKKNQVCKVAALSLLGIWLAGDARADFTAAEVNFIMTDKDGDLLLDKAEVLEGTMNDFGAIHQDNDNQLSKEEVGDSIDEAEFADGDKNKDGSLAIEEVIEERLADFNRTDTDGDGALSVDEAVNFMPVQ